MSHAIESAKRARMAAGSLARASTEDKNRALFAIARAIMEHSHEILAANEQDLEMAQALVEKGELADSLFQRLKLDRHKLAAIVAGIEQVAAMEDPVGKVTFAIELDQGLRLYRVNCPIG